MKLLSLRGYSRHKGVSLKAVQKAIESGRIRTVTDAKGKVKIDPEDADRQWALRSDPSKQRPLAAVEVEISAESGGKEPDFDSETEDGDGVDFFKARAKREFYKAKIEKLNHDLRAGQLVEVARIETEWQKIITTTKSKLLAVPSKLRNRVPHFTLADLATIEEEIREALEELADLPKGSEE